MKGMGMKFVKLHQNGKQLLVNLSNVSEIYTMNNKSGLQFNFAVRDEQESISVDESLDEILELIKQVSA